MKKIVVTIHQAKTNLAQLLQRAAKGEQVIIARGVKHVAQLVPINQVSGVRQPGSLKGKLQISDEFFKPLSTDEGTAWE